jgi:hypothetical protein
VNIQVIYFNYSKQQLKKLELNGQGSGGGVIPVSEARADISIQLPSGSQINP